MAPASARLGQSADVFWLAGHIALALLGVWCFDQLIGIYYVHVPIRMTVVRLEAGGLFVYAPVAPTRECLDLLQPLIDEHGPVKYIVLPSVAVEHKVTLPSYHPTPTSCCRC